MLLSKARRQWFIVALLSALPLSFLLGLASGAIELSLVDALLSLFGAGSEREQMVVQVIRLPRVLLAALLGSILALCGAAMQGLFRNPLADPSLIGVTAGASLGASLAIVFAGVLVDVSGFSALTLLMFGAFVGGLIATWLVFRLASDGQSTSVATMLLAGIAVTALAGAVGNLLEYYANNQMLRHISLWRMGGMDGANGTQVCVALVVAVGLCAAIPRFASALNAMLLGESEARYLGVDVQRCKRYLILLVALGVGTSVALAGTIAFVGLVVPHISRLLVGPDHRYVLPVSALAGAVLLVLADTFARVIVLPSELPVGVVTAMLGAPFFISLLRQRRVYGMP